MGGVVLKGEPIEAAATRKLKQETGLDAEFKLVGMERRVLYKQGELFSDVLFPIAYADSCTGDLIVDSAFGHNMWVPVDEAIKNDTAEFDSIPSIVKVLKAIKKGGIDALPFFFEETVQSDAIEEAK
jgi:8-oxo-dGTP pyrophosphatase MutT (NUDIX family)